MKKCEHGNVYCEKCEQKLINSSVEAFRHSMELIGKDIANMQKAFERIASLTLFYDEAVREEVHEIAISFVSKVNPSHVG